MKKFMRRVTPSPDVVPVEQNVAAAAAEAAARPGSALAGEAAAAEPEARWSLEITLAGDAARVRLAPAVVPAPAAPPSSVVRPVAMRSRLASGHRPLLRPTAGYDPTLSPVPSPRVATRSLSQCVITRAPEQPFGITFALLDRPRGREPVRHCRCLVFPLCSRLRHCLCLVLPLYSWLRQRLSLRTSRPTTCGSRCPGTRTAASA